MPAALYSIVFATDVTGPTEIRSMPLQLKKFLTAKRRQVHLATDRAIPPSSDSGSANPNFP